MKVELDRSKLRDDTERVMLLQWLHFLMILLSILLHFTHNLCGFWLTVAKFGFFTFYYRLFFISVKRRYYTYWTLAVLLFIFSFYSFFEILVTHATPSIAWCHLIVCILLCTQAYILYSPIYYPQVRWWEYDFRYRNDLKIKAVVDDKESEGRLTDLRRGAGCIVLFEELPLEKRFFIRTMSSRVLELKGEIMSKREYSIGRGFTYGVRFLFDEPEERQEFDAFSRLWKMERSLKAKSRFTSEISETADYET